MAALRLRDRDAIVTVEGLIFRVLGYSHLKSAYVCDVEYAPSEIFRSENPKAFRTDGRRVFYKFYEDEGWRFIERSFPRYMIFHGTLNRMVLGVKHDDVAEARKPGETLEKLLKGERKDGLLTALQNVLETVTERSSLSMRDFGVFGSLLHGFYHPKFSDIDLVVYGGGNAVKLRETLQELYRDNSSPFKNEFGDDKLIEKRGWRFQNYSLEEFIRHQRRKMVYAVLHDKALSRTVKVEFEPVRGWGEIYDEHSGINRVVQEGWVKAIARVSDDEGAAFMPSIYSIEVAELMDGPKVDDIRRVVSYVEEFRMQAWKDDVVYVEGNLEKVESPNGSFHQVTLTYGPRYYEQVIKSLR